ncbi:hypothetical protein ES703_45067 [subsurface metagenome]
MIFQPQPDLVFLFLTSPLVLLYNSVSGSELGSMAENCHGKEIHTVAKLKGPLMSLGAAGKLADTLVYFNWKGINCVREYVIPANPKTDLQNTQRDYLTTMVTAVHTAQAKAAHALRSDDLVAYAALAAAKGKIMTWFNQAVKLGLDCLRASEGYTIYSHGHCPDTSKDDLRPMVYITDDGALHVAAGKFYLGTSKTNLIHTCAGVLDEGVYASASPGFGFSGLVAGTKYYWQFRPDSPDPCEGADSGIYSCYAT